MDPTEDSVQTPEIPEPTNLVPVPRATRTKEACRPLGELMDANPKSMTPKEAAMVINQLREELLITQNKLHEATLTAQSAFAQYKQAENNHQSLLQEFNAKMRMVEDMSRVFYTSIKMVGGSR